VTSNSGPVQPEIAIFMDDTSYQLCGIPDAATLVACGLTGADCGNAPIVPYGQLSLTYAGQFTRR